MNKIIKSLSFIVLLLSIMTLVVCFYFPVYTDEILWKVLQGRYWYDGKQMLNYCLMPSCQQYSLKVPALLLPYRILNTLLFNQLSSPLAIRLFGIGMGLTWLSITGFFLNKLVSTQMKSKTLILCLISFATLGVMPFMLVFSRPEQFLLIGITLFFLPLLKNNSLQSQTYGMGCVNAVGIFLLASFLFTVHLKAILILPLILLFIHRFVRVRCLAYVCMLVTCGFAFIIYHYWMNGFSCPGDPYIRELYRSHNVGFSLNNIHEFKQYIIVFLNALNNPISWFLFFVTEKNHYISNMIPPFTISSSLYFGEMLFYFLSYTFGMGFILFLYGLYKSWREKSLRLSYFAIGSIWLFYFLCVFARIHKNDYEAALLVPLLALAFAGTIFLSWSTLENILGKNFVKRCANSFFLLLFVFSILSQFFLIRNFLPYVMSSWSHPGYLTGQLFSISNFGYDKQRTKIIETAEKCGIYKEHKLQHLVVDELTYFSFKNSYQPFFMTMLDEHGWSKHLAADPSQLLEYYQSAGMIVGCGRVPSALKGRVIQNGEFCCLPKFIGNRSRLER